RAAAARRSVALRMPGSRVGRLILRVGGNQAPGSPPSVLLGLPTRAEEVARLETSVNPRRDDERVEDPSDAAPASAPLAPRRFLCRHAAPRCPAARYAAYLDFRENGTGAGESHPGKCEGAVIS